MTSGIPKKLVPLFVLLLVSCGGKLTPITVQAPPATTQDQTPNPTATTTKMILSASPSSPSIGTLSSHEIIVTRDDIGLRPGCRPGDIANLIARFFDAFNRGDEAELARFFNSNLNWYSVSEGLVSEGGTHFVTYTPETLLGYFAERHKHGEHLRLLIVRANASVISDRVDIVYGLMRQADDLLSGPGEHDYAGKGSTNCKEQKIFVWSMGAPIEKDPQPVTPPPNGLCPAPPSGSSPYAIIACTW